MFEQLLEIFRPINLIDIGIVTLVTYKLMMLLKGSRAVQLIKGLMVLLVMTIVSGILGLQSVNWVLEKLQTVFLIAIPIVFQPELRRALEQLGRGKLFNRTNTIDQQLLEKNVDALLRSVVHMAKEQIGALIVLKRETGLVEYVETGIPIQGKLSTELMINIFIPNTPLHDGAVIVEGDKILAASCFLPLSENKQISKELGTRHRAALGVSEVSDALVLIVSEETGAISLAEDGKLIRDIKEVKLRELLLKKLKTNEQNNSLFAIWRD